MNFPIPLPRAWLQRWHHTPGENQSLSETVPIIETLEHGRSQRAPLSQPTLHRSTPITTTGPSFTVRLDSEGAVKLRIAGVKELRIVPMPDLREFV
jgi:hypothetical protein